MTGSAALYQAALVLIPALLFGGAIRQAGKTHRKLGGGKLLGFAIVAGLLAGVIAEGIALQGAIEPAGVHEFSQRYLTGVLTLGTTGLAVWAASPLLVKRSGWVRLEPIRIGIVLALSVVLGQYFIGKSLNTALTHAEFEEVAKRQFESEKSLQTAEERNLVAREHLIGVAAASREPVKAVDFEQGLISRFDAKQAEIHGLLKAPHAVHRLNRVFRSLTMVSLNLEPSLDSRLSVIGSTERDLLLLSERRLIATTRMLMTDAANEVLSERELRSICGDSPNPACRRAQ